MKKLIVSLPLMASLFLASCGNAQNNETETENNNAEEKVVVEQINIDVDAQTFSELIAKENGVVLDVRTDNEFFAGHISGALHFDFYRDDFKVLLTDLDPKTPVYVYCKSGGRSGKTANMLKGMGFSEVYNLEGGITAWENQGKPVEK